MTPRLGIVLDRLDIEAWQEAMLQKIEADQAGTTVVILLCRELPRMRQANAVLSLYQLLDRRLFKYRPDAFKKRSIRTLLPEVPIVEFSLGAQGDGGTHLSDAGRLMIESHRLDVILHLAASAPLPALGPMAGYGVWSILEGDQILFRGGPPGFWELAENSPVIGSVLRVERGSRERSHILASSFSRTHKLSLNKSRNITLWKAASFVPRALRELSKLGGKEFIRRLEQEEKNPRFQSGRVRSGPGLVASLGFLFRQLWRTMAAFASRKLTIDQWMLAFSFGEKVNTSFWSYERIVPPKDRFWADPQVIRRNGEYFVFIEEYPYARRKGHVSVFKLSPGARPESPTTVLERDYHLSFPFVFEWNGICYMIPETSKNGTIELYESGAFPQGWKLRKVLMDNVRAVDTTLLHHAGLWWLFANIAENEGGETTDELFVFWANDFLSDEWKPHPMNPVVSDVRTSRPAGRIFEAGGSLIRPSQDCSEEYGGGVNFQRIVTLTTSKYKEESALACKPEWDKQVVGLHTYSRDADLAVIDLCLRRRS